ncbi:hypothetical protein OB69_01585 [Roseivirga seohaensis subsp. aquiponti]|uniref:Uncharacterized protein n=1 Tax=Roseivirga seohaensis subsp. aquiponti TaxID=1566026 RepID=A0A0L8APU1_9BACT|nr:hypothetical protein OB69_01585 [Roseivirga seohaensis subsp. aquiponti]
MGLILSYYQAFKLTSTLGIKNPKQQCFGFFALQHKNETVKTVGVSLFIYCPRFQPWAICVKGT